MYYLFYDSLPSSLGPAPSKVVLRKGNLARSVYTFSSGKLSVILVNGGDTDQPVGETTILGGLDNKAVWWQTKLPGVRNCAAPNMVIVTSMARLM